MSLKLRPGCFYGTPSKRFDTSDLRLTEIVYPPEHKTPEHLHERAYFALTLKGAHTKFYGQQRVQCGPQTLIFHPPYQRQSGYSSKAGAQSFLIEIEPRLFDRLCSYPLTTDSLVIFRGGAMNLFARRLYKEFRQRDELSALMIEGLLLEMLAEATRGYGNKPHRKPPHWLEQAKEMIYAQFSESLTVSSIARTVGVHPVYLASEFRRAYHITIGEQIRKLRIDFACCKISTTAASLVEIALESGFSSQSHFSTSFRRVMGMTATQYRSFFRSP
jgi:AraC family transcriptional regulator